MACAPSAAQALLVIAVGERHLFEAGRRCSPTLVNAVRFEAEFIACRQQAAPHFMPRKRAADQRRTMNPQRNYARYREYERTAFPPPCHHAAAGQFLCAKLIPLSGRY